MAKVGNILHELDNGWIALHKGKSLDEINIENDEELELEQNDSESDQDEADLDGENVSISEERVKGKEKMIGEQQRRKPRKQSVKRPWSDEEMGAINLTLSKYFTPEKLPGKHEIVEA